MASLNETLAGKVLELEARLVELEKTVEKYKRKRAFKTYVIVASSDECFDVLTSDMINQHMKKIFKKKEHRDVVYYCPLRTYLDNAEILIIKKDYFEKWRINKRYYQIRFEDLDELFAN